MSFLIAVVSFLVAINILVAVHEFGHFWVAKKLKIKVLEFSIGFGKVLKSWKIGEVEYTFRLIPLGGFVKMLNEHEGFVAKEEKHRAFNNQSVYKRASVAIAGPLANFIFAIIAYTIIIFIGVTGIKPIISNVTINGIAERSGLKSQDTILNINNQKTPTISEFNINFIQYSADNVPINIEVLTKANDLKTIKLNLDSDFLKNPEQKINEYLGFQFAAPKLEAIIDKVIANSAAIKAGILTNDHILKANGGNIDSWQSFVRIVQNNPEKNIELQIRRNQKIIYTTLTPENKNGIGKAGISVLVPKSNSNDSLIIVKKSLLASFLSANKKVYKLTKLNLQIIKKMLLGDISIKHISGPIGIANYAGKAAQTNFILFLSFLAIISVGLGIINLLPIPLLDGGHLFFYLIEIIKGSEVSQKSQQLTAKFGLFIIILLTSIALYNDLSNFL